MSPVLDGEAQCPVPQMSPLPLSRVHHGEEILGRGWWKLEEVDHVTGVELEAESGLTLRMAAAITDLAPGAGNSVLGLAGEDAVLEELSSQGNSPDAADEFGEEFPVDFEALRSDLHRDLERGEEGLTDAVGIVVHVRSFASSVGEE